MKLDNMNLPDELAVKLENAEKRWLGVQSMTITLVSFVTFFSSLVIMYLSDRLWDTSPIFRFLLLLITIISFVSLVVNYFRSKWSYTQTPYKIINLIQKHFPALGDSLQGAVELSHEESRPDNISPELCRAAVSQVADQTAPLEFNDAVQTTVRNKMSRWFTLLAVIILAMAATDSQALFNSIERWINPFSSVQRYTFVQIEELPKELVVLHGEPFELEIVLKDESRIKADQVFWNFGRLGQQSASLSNGRAILNLPGQTEKVDLYISSFDMSRTVRIIPVHRPALTELKAQVQMPEYLQHEDLQLELQGKSIELIQGSHLSISGVSSNELQNVEIYRPDLNLASAIFDFTSLSSFIDLSDLVSSYRQTGASITESISKFGFKSQLFEARDNDQLYISWQDKYGFEQKKPHHLQISTIEDEAPRVEFENVSRSFALLVSENITLPMTADDNFGIKYLKVEYEVQSGGNANFSKTFSHTIKKGRPSMKFLEGEFIFSPNQLEIEAGSLVKIRALTNDYLPARKDVISTEYKIYVLSKEEHARLIQERFESLNSKLEGVGMQEDENLQKNLQIAEMEADELNSQEGTDALEESLEAEKANARRLEQLINEGQQLVEEALKNEEFAEDELREWTDMLDELDDLRENELAEAQEGLAQASQEESAGSGLRIEGLKSAIQKQQEALRKLRRLSKDFDENMKQATLRSFASRLRKMSKEQSKISDKLKELFVKSVGLDFEKLPDSLKKLNDEIFLTQKKDINGDITGIKHEMVSFYARTKIEKYREVTDDMEKQKVEEELAALLKLIELNKASVGIKPSKRWSEQFKKWADMLDAKVENDNEENDQNEQQQQEQNMEMLLAIIRLIEEEQDIHAETKFIEWERQKDGDAKAIEEKHKKASEQLADRQKNNKDKLKEIRQKLKPSKGTKLMDDAENAMDEAERLLRKYKSGTTTLAAEAAAIELLISLFDSNNQGGGSSSSMSAMMQQMMQGSSTGSQSSSSGNNSGGQAAVPTDVKGADSGDDLAERERSKHSGISLEDVPLEFRDALESYYKEVEKNLE